MLTNENIDYCPLYCEENIWRLCQLQEFADKQTFVLFISNPTKSCAMWQQQSATTNLYPVVWDYHVVLLVKTLALAMQSNSDDQMDNNHCWRVYDLDSQLHLGVEVDDYLCQSFQPPIGAIVPTIPVTSEFTPCFKLVCGKSYAAHFSSDRKHMHDSDGGWISLPPLWPLIIGDQAMSLERLIDMTNGDVLTLSTLKSTLVDLL